MSIFVEVGLVIGIFSVMLAICSILLIVDYGFDDYNYRLITLIISLIIALFSGILCFVNTNCPNCNETMTNYKRYVGYSNCPTCGFEFKHKCISCENPLNNNELFCTDCGKKQTSICDICGKSFEEHNETYCLDCKRELVKQN